MMMKDLVCCGAEPGGKPRWLNFNFFRSAYAYIHLNFMVRFRGFSVPGPTRLFLRIYYRKV